MLKFATLLLSLALFADGAPGPETAPPGPEACGALDRAADGPQDSAPLLRACLATIADGQRLALKPGLYTLRSPMILDRPVTLTSRGLRFDMPACRPEGDVRCATLGIGALDIGAWPVTSGRFDGSAFTRNDIDCGEEMRCGFGIMVGANPWYPGKASGGTVENNRIARAMIGINVDGLTGPMTIGDNMVSASGGRFGSRCGTRLWPAVNLAPASRPFLKGTIAGGASGAVDTRKCLLNVKPR